MQLYINTHTHTHGSVTLSELRVGGCRNVCNDFLPWLERESRLELEKYTCNSKRGKKEKNSREDSLNRVREPLALLAQQKKKKDLRWRESRA